MEPIAIVTAFVAALFVVGRDGLVIAPAATVSFYRRVFYASQGRIRILGAGILIVVALPLIVTARQAPAAQDDITIWLQGLG